MTCLRPHRPDRLHTKPGTLHCWATTRTRAASLELISKLRAWFFMQKGIARTRGDSPLYLPVRTRGAPLVSSERPYLSVSCEAPRKRMYCYWSCAFSGARSLTIRSTLLAAVSCFTLSISRLIVKKSENRLFTGAFA
jgi:hypothetical protein